MRDRPELRSRRVDGEVDRQVRRGPRARCARPPRGPGGRARRRRGRRPPARPCGGRSASRGCRSASRRTEMLPSPAEISPRLPSRRPARSTCSVAVDRGSTGTSYDAAPGRRPVTGRGGQGRPPWTARSGADAPVPSADAPGTHPRAAACPEPRLQGPAHEPGRLVAGGRGQLRGAPAARPRPDRLGIRDGRRRGHPDAARPVLRDDRRRHRRPERPEADDVRRRPRSGPA